MRVSYLVDRPAEDVATIAGWFMDEWGPEHIDAWLPLIGGVLQEGVLPTTFVAVEHDQLLCTASLLAAGPADLPAYSPWLASVYIPPAGRRRGVCAALLRRVELEARILGFPRLYFETSGPAEPYQALGWRWVGSTLSAESHSKVLMLDLTAMDRAA